MIIMETGASESDIAAVIAEVRKHGLRSDIVRENASTVINVVGDQSGVPFAAFAGLPGVRQAERIEKPYRLINRECAREYGGDTGRRVIHVGDVAIGGDEPVFIAGPCAVQSRQQLFDIQEYIAAKSIPSSVKAACFIVPSLSGSMPCGYLAIRPRLASLNTER